MFTLQSLAPSLTGDDLISVYYLILVTLANRPKNFARFLREIFSHIVVCAFQFFHTFVVPCVVNVLSICSRVHTELRPELTRVTPKTRRTAFKVLRGVFSPQVPHGQSVLRVRESQCHIASPRGVARAWRTLVHCVLHLVHRLPPRACLWVLYRYVCLSFLRVRHLC